jgi:hypothetical protein
VVGSRKKKEIMANARSKKNVQVNAPRRSRRPRGNTGRIRGTQEAIRVNYNELWRSVSGPTPGGTTSPEALRFVPGVSGLPQLDALGSLYESYRLTAPVKIVFKSSSGTVNNGSVIAGVDYDARDVQLGYSSAAAKMPKFVGPIWKDHRLHVDPSRAMNKKWLFSETLNGAFGEAAFALVYSASGGDVDGAVGEIWCEYSVEFISPRAVPLINSGSQENKIWAPNGTQEITSEFTSVGKPTAAAECIQDGSAINTGHYQARARGTLNPGLYIGTMSVLPSGGIFSATFTPPAHENLKVIEVSQVANRSYQVLFELLRAVTNLEFINAVTSKESAVFLSQLAFLTTTVRRSLFS